MITEEQVKSAAVNAGFPDRYREAFVMGLLHNLNIFNEWVHLLTPDIVVRWLALGMYLAERENFSRPQLFEVLVKFVTELFTDPEQQAVALAAVNVLKEMIELADSH